LLADAVPIVSQALSSGTLSVNDHCQDIEVIAKRVKLKNDDHDTTDSNTTSVLLKRKAATIDINEVTVAAKQAQTKLKNDKAKKKRLEASKQGALESIEAIILFISSHLIKTMPLKEFEYYFS
jgi:hypothetical protein